jgi:hypothetical protein
MKGSPAWATGAFEFWLDVMYCTTRMGLSPVAMKSPGLAAEGPPTSSWSVCPLLSTWGPAGRPVTPGVAVKLTVVLSSEATTCQSTASAPPEVLRRGWREAT